MIQWKSKFACEKKKKSHMPVTSEELSFEHVSDKLAIHKVCKFSTVSG